MRVPLHVVEARRKQLAELVQDGGFLPLAEVCAKLGISEATARRDLTALAKDRTITRTRGGALCEYNQRFPSFRERQAVAGKAKRAIAAAAARLIRPGMTVFLDAGSTLFAVAEAIAAAPRTLTVVTNNLPVAELLADAPGVTVNLLGGQYLRRLSVLLGPESVRHLRAWSFDLALLGAEGMDADGLSNSTPDVVAVQRAALARARVHAVCVDAAKLGRRAPEALAGWADIGRLVTDATTARLRAAGIRLPADRLTVA